jgi:hypothetical protein
MIRSLRATRLRTSGSDQKTSAMRTIYATACLTVLLAGQANSATVASSIENLNCKSGPVARTYGKTKWLVYGCDDDRTAIVVAAPGNPAFPFYFRLSPQNEGYHLTGEGTGNKEATDSAYRDLSMLSKNEIVALIAEAKRH